VSQDTVVIMQLVVTAATAGVLLASCIIAYRSLALSRLLKAVEISMEMEAKFNRLVHQDGPNYWTNEPRTRAFYVAFWRLQCDQYKLWRMGMIPSAFIRAWLEHRKEEFIGNQSIVSSETNTAPTLISYIDGWKFARGKLPNSDFVQFMDVLQRDGVDLAIRAARDPRLMSRLSQRRAA